MYLGSFFRSLIAQGWETTNLGRPCLPAIASKIPGAEDRGLALQLRVPVYGLVDAALLGGHPLRSRIQDTRRSRFRLNGPPIHR
jgi:hypothetical protein